MLFQLLFGNLKLLMPVINMQDSDIYSAIYMVTTVCSTLMLQLQTASGTLKLKHLLLYLSLIVWCHLYSAIYML